MGAVDGFIDGLQGTELIDRAKWPATGDREPDGRASVARHRLTCGCEFQHRNSPEMVGQIRIDLSGSNTSFHYNQCILREPGSGIIVQVSLNKAKSGKCRNKSIKSHLTSRSRMPMG